MTTLDECFSVGLNGGLPDTPEERARFEAYMRGHSWYVGGYDEDLKCYDTVRVRMLYGVWLDRGSLAEKAESELKAIKSAEMPEEPESLANWKLQETAMGLPKDDYDVLQYIYALRAYALRMTAELKTAFDKDLQLKTLIELEAEVARMKAEAEALRARLREYGVPDEDVERQIAACAGGRVDMFKAISGPNREFNAAIDKERKS